MRTIVAVISSIAFLAGTVTAADALPRRKAHKTVRYRTPAPERTVSQTDGYREQWSDHLPFGSSAWWEQMQREGRLGGDKP